MENLKAAIAKFKNKRILVIGDIMLDQYTEGIVTHISPEAPVPIIKKMEENFVPGGAGNVANNLASLGAEAVLAGVVGKDAKGKLLLQLLKQKKINTAKIVVSNTRPTTVKERIVSGNNQLLRIDQENTENLTITEENKFWNQIKNEIKKCDVVLLSDYAKGLFSKNLTRKIINSAKKNKKKIIADFKSKNKNYFIGVDIITPNLKEARELTNLEDLRKIGQKLVKDFGSDVIITRGEEGMSIFREVSDKGTHLPAKKIRVFDVSGAGDTVCAVLSLGIASGLDLVEAGTLANYAGGIVVQKPGTATVSTEELETSLNSHNHTDNLDMVPKLWGYEKWIENNDKYCCKLLSLNKGYQCSLHYHKNKDEMFLVTSGHVKMEIGKEILHLREGNFVRIPPKTPHRFTGMENSLIVESSTHHDEKDVYRKEVSRKVIH